MSQSSTANEVALEVADAVSPDEALQSRKERVLAGRLLIGLLLIVVLVVVVVVLFGLPALNFVALTASALVFIILVAYATGF